MASLYKRGRQFWISYRLNGRRVQLALDTTNERIARDKKRQIEYELTVGLLQTASRLPLAAVVEDFCQHLQARSPHKARRTDFGRLRCFFGPICKSLHLGTRGGQSQKPSPDKYAHAHLRVELLEDLTSEMINRFISARLRESAWAAKTANSHREILHRLFAFAIKHHGFCSRDRRYPNPGAAVERHSEPAPEIRFLKLDEVEEQLHILEDHPALRALVATYIYAGLRREEALWLTHDDLDLEQRMIRVRAKTIDGEYWQPKTKRNRAVPISEPLSAILRAYEPPCRSYWFFPSPAGLRWNPDNLSQDLRAINRKQDLDWSCLDYRHTFGSQLAQKGESLYKIATLMGNSPGICQRHYAALIPEAMHETVEFVRTEPQTTKDPETKVLLEQILQKLEEKQPVGPQRPRLRLVGTGDGDQSTC